MSDNLKDRLLDVAAATGPNEARQIALAAADRIKELEAKLAKAVEALRELIDHTHNCEKELTEELHNADFCGESLPLTSARATLAELKGGKDE